MRLRAGTGRFPAGFVVFLMCVHPLAVGAAQSRHAPPRPPGPAQAGRDLLAQGDAEGALAEFERVLAETGDPTLGLDIARTLSALGRHVESVERYERYLSEVTAATPGADLVVADAELAAEMYRIGEILIRTDVEGVEVRLDGRQAGWSPISMPLRVDPGRHVVEMYHPRYRDERLEVRVEPGEFEEVYVVMQLPPVEPAPTGPSRAELAAQAAEDEWTRGGWNPIPRVMPWGWANSVPAGFMLSAGVGVGDLTRIEKLEWSAGGDDRYDMVDYGPTIPGFAGYRLEAAPMFAFGWYFAWQFHEADTHTLGRPAEAYSLHTGAGARIFVPLGLLEPFVGAGFGYARVDFESTGPLLDDRQTTTFQGLSVPLSVGFDVVPLDFLTAGFSFAWAFGFWLEECHSSARAENSRGCYDPTKPRTNPTTLETTPAEEVPDAWWFDFHVTFYLG